MPGLDQFALPVGPRILVTGANGYIGSHVVDVLLERGFNVRGTVRDAKTWLDQVFEDRQRPGKFDSIVLPTLEDRHALNAAMNGIVGVVHVAAETSLKDDKMIVPNARKAITSVLDAAAQHESIMRFVLTSSSSAAVIPKPNEKGVSVDEYSWKDEMVSLEQPGTAPAETAGFVTYAASKTEAERTAWKWCEENKPGFFLNTVLPNFNLGTIFKPDKTPASTMGFVRNLFKGDTSAMDFIPPQYYINVRDDAMLHAAALLDEGINGERIYAFAKEFNWTDILSILRKLRPAREFPADPVDEGRDYTDVKLIPRAGEILKRFSGQLGWTSLEDSLRNGIADIE